MILALLLFVIAVGGCSSPQLEADCDPLCDTGWACDFGVCVKLCNGDGDCPKTHACDGGACVEVQNAECTADADCDTPPADCHETDGECWGGACSYPAEPYGTSCGAGDPCVGSPFCDNEGACVSTGGLDCSTPPDNVCSPDGKNLIVYTGGADCITGVGCAEFPATKIECPCVVVDDGDDVCTSEIDLCDSAEIDCTPAECEASAECDPATGKCERTAAANGTACTAIGTIATAICLGGGGDEVCFDGICQSGGCFARSTVDAALSKDRYYCAGERDPENYCLTCGFDECGERPTAIYEICDTTVSCDADAANHYPGATAPKGFCAAGECHDSATYHPACSDCQQH